MSTTRRQFLGAAGLTSLGIAAAQGKRVPVGLELYSVRNELQKDLPGTVRAVAKMGYQDVEFFSPYYNWTTDQAKDVRKLLNELGIKCLSTHNGIASYKPENIQKTIELNNILGVRYVVIASAGKAETLDDWKRVADSLAQGHQAIHTGGLRGGYHNHQAEFKAIDGKRPIEVIAANTPKDFMMQFDVGTCVEVGGDPVAWVNANPGRIRSMHLKEWSKDRGYRVLFNEGAVPWKQLLAAAEKTGGVEYYLIEQEGSDYPEIETAQRCLDAYKKLRA